ncbi:MAG: hypothetical protein AAF208_04855, partial [Cyanobacteria bacterium P01_A01_bin.45]
MQMQEKDIQEKDIQNYIKKIILDEKTLDKKPEILVSYPEKTDEKGHITVICGKNHSGKSYVLKKISEALTKTEERKKYNKDEGILQCAETNLKVEFSSLGDDLPEVGKILSIGDSTSTKRIYEQINSITFKELRDNKIFTCALYFNDDKNSFLKILTSTNLKENFRLSRSPVRRWRPRTITLNCWCPSSASPSSCSFSTAIP